MINFKLPTVCILFCAIGTTANAQSSNQGTQLLAGTVQQIDSVAKRLSVANDPIPGGMGAMTMSYKVADDSILKRVKPGDRITAKIRDGDMTLYDVQVVKAASAPAAESQPQLHLEDLERIALAHNPTVAQVQANVRVAAGLARQAGLYPNPSVGYYGDDIRGGDYRGGKQGGFVSQTIVTGGKLRAARRVADVLTSQAETAGDVQRLRILNNVRSAFYQLLADQRLEAVRRNLAQLASDATETSHQLANVGQADRPDVLEAEVEQQQAILALHVAEQNVRKGWRILAAVVGKPELPQSSLAGDLEAVPVLTYDDWLATTLRDSPEIKLAQEDIERSQAILTEAKKAPIPDLQLYGNLAQNNEPLNPTLVTTRRPVGLNGGVQIGVQLPIFNWNQGNVAAAKADVERAKQELVRFKLQIARELASQFRDYESAQSAVLQYKNEMLPRAEQAYKLYQMNYRSMAAAYPQVLISQRTFFQLQVEYFQALTTAWQSALGIRGFGLMDGLSSPASRPGIEATRTGYGSNQSYTGQPGFSQ